MPKLTTIHYLNQPSWTVAAKILLKVHKIYSEQNGLSPLDPSTTHPVFYPGGNQLGRVLESIRTELHRESVLVKQRSTDKCDVPITPVPADKQHAPASQENASGQFHERVPCYQNTISCIILVF